MPSYTGWTESDIWFNHFITKWHIWIDITFLVDDFFTAYQQQQGEAALQWTLKIIQWIHPFIIYSAGYGGTGVHPGQVTSPSQAPTYRLFSDIGTEVRWCCMWERECLKMLLWTFSPTFSASPLVKCSENVRVRLERENFWKVQSERGVSLMLL